MRMLLVPSMLYLSQCVLICTLHIIDTAVKGVWVFCVAADPNGASVVEGARRECHRL